MLRRALDSGIRVLNTADFYTGLGEGDEVSSNIKFIGAPLVRIIHAASQCNMAARDSVIGPCHKL